MEEIREGEKLRWGYGFCWQNWNRNTTTTCLVPFNFILRWVRELYFWLASPQRSKRDIEIKNKISEQWKLGYNAGKQQTLDQIGCEYRKLFKD